MIGRAIIRLIRFYQRYLSGMKKTSTCRFSPTCSHYAVEAIQRHGALCGGALAIWRVLRCNPLVKPGYDPVPEKLFWQK